MQRTVCFRFDLRFSPSDEAFGAWSGEPAYVVKLFHLARESGARFQFFVSLRTARAFPDLLDVIVGEGHALAPLVEGEGDYERLAALFRAQNLELTGAALAEGAGPAGADMSANGGWLAVETAEQGAGFGGPLAACVGLRTAIWGADVDRAQQVREAVEGLGRAFQLAEERLVIWSYPGLLSWVDPGCVVVREGLRLSAEYRRKLVTCIDLAQ